jgi:exopolysaccharide biosynthesis polyprenyl glycosylphosphotransferase
MTTLSEPQVVRRPPELDVLRSPGLRWEDRYLRSAVVIDTMAGLLAAFVAFFGRFGEEGPRIYLAGALAFPVAWLLLLALNRSYESQLFGMGSAEFRRIINAGVGLTAAVGFFSYLLKVQIARGFVVIVVPLAVLFGLAGRLALRKYLHRRRRRGECMHRVVAVGHRLAVADLVRQLRRERHHGLEIVGACLPEAAQDADLLSLQVPVVGGFDSVAHAAELTGADTVAVLSSPELGGAALRQLAWSLEGTDVELVVAPGLIEVVGPRLTIRPVEGLPLLHVERPTLSGNRKLLKGGFDRSVAIVGLTVLAPFIVAIGIAVAVTSPGGVFFRQTRIGAHGRPFRIVKFRTMVADAEIRRAELQDSNDSGADDVLFKIRDDPRVTRVGKVLRRYSLDELPQLANIVVGHMSLVGPRPPLPEEVDRYTDHAHRRLLVKPGVTGLWQVSGRSDLSWDESVKLDLRYVDNWSLALDMLILWKTGRAVVEGSGAY